MRRPCIWNPSSACASLLHQGLGRHTTSRSHLVPAVRSCVDFEMRNFQQELTTGLPHDLFATLEYQPHPTSYQLLSSFIYLARLLLHHALASANARSSGNVSSRFSIFLVPWSEATGALRDCCGRSLRRSSELEKGMMKPPPSSVAMLLFHALYLSQ